MCFVGGEKYRRSQLNLSKIIHYVSLAKLIIYWPRLRRRDKNSSEPLRLLLSCDSLGCFQRRSLLSHQQNDNVGCWKSSFNRTSLLCLWWNGTLRFSIRLEQDWNIHSRFMFRENTSSLSLCSVYVCFMISDLFQFFPRSLQRESF